MQRELERQNMDNTLDFDRFNNIPARYFESVDRNELKRQLTLFIMDLLENDFTRLCNLIYRHDIPEPKFNAALQVLDLEVQASQIADLVIEREMQKIATRKAYREFKEDQDRKSLED